jgi:hypothetical protein
MLRNHQCKIFYIYNLYFILYVLLISTTMAFNNLNNKLKINLHKVLGKSMPKIKKDIIFYSDTLHAIPLSYRTARCIITRYMHSTRKTNDCTSSYNVKYDVNKPNDARIITFSLNVV